MIHGVRLTDLNAAAEHMCEGCRGILLDLNVTGIERYTEPKLIELRGEICRDIGIAEADVLRRSQAHIAVNRRRKFVRAAAKRGCSLHEMGKMLLMHHTTIHYLLKGKPKHDRIAVS